MADDSHVVVPSDNCAPTTFPGSMENANGFNDDILQQLDFSVRDLLDPADDPNLSLWDLDEILNYEPASSFNATMPTEFSVCDQNSHSSYTAVIQSSNTPCYSGCSLLRQVVHTDGVQSMKLSIHGGPGVFCHATLAVCGNTSVPPAEPYCINLRERTMEQVKQFLIDYGMLRMQDRCYLIEDSLSAFYEALCVRFIDESASAPLPEQGGLCESRHPEVYDQEQIPIHKSGIAAQRERTGKMKLSELAKFFHLPIVEASKELKLCPTAIKKICRKYGLARWPYRKVRSIDKNMEKLLQEIPERDEQDVSQIISEVNKLEQRRARIYRGRESM